MYEYISMTTDSYVQSWIRIKETLKPCDNRKHLNETDAKLFTHNVKLWDTEKQSIIALKRQFNENVSEYTIIM